MAGAETVVVGVHHTQPVVGGQSVVGALASLVTGGSADHVEVILPEPCADELMRRRRGATCHTCRMKLGRQPTPQMNPSALCGAHTRRYAVTQTKPLQLLLDDPHPPYRGSTWTSYAVRLPPGQLRALQGFLDEQLGKPFNAQGMWWNFMPGQALWAALGRTQGLHERVDDVQALRALHSDSWFCSELMCAALNAASPEFRALGLTPAYTSPAMLEHALRRGMPKHAAVELPLGATFGNLAEHFNVQTRAIDVRLQAP